MKGRNQLKKQLEFLATNGSLAQETFEYLGDRDPSIMQIAGFAKTMETTYNFLEGALKVFAQHAGESFSGDSSHKELLDWALDIRFCDMPLLPDGVDFDGWRMFRHKMKYQSIDLIAWGMIKGSIGALKSSTDLIADHFNKVADRIELEEEKAKETEGKDTSTVEERRSDDPSGDS